MDERIMAVQRMQEHIAAHADEEITLSDLARVSLFSPWHSHRIFKEHTGLTPGEYIRKLRLSRAALRLKSGAANVTDAALDSGFDSPDAYRRAFVKEFALKPSDYAKNPVPIALFIPYGVKFKELGKEITNMENVQSVFIQVIEKPARRVVVKRGIKADSYFPYCYEVGCDVWGVLMSMDSLCGEPVCLWLPAKYRKPNTSTYVQGVEVACDYCGPIPEGFDIIDLPAAKYLMFQGEPFREEDYATAIEALQCAMDRYEPKLIGLEWDDENPRIQLEPRGERGYIELRAVKHSGK